MIWRSHRSLGDTYLLGLGVARFLWFGQLIEEVLGEYFARVGGLQRVLPPYGLEWVVGGLHGCFVSTEDVVLQSVLPHLQQKLGHMARVLGLGDQLAEGLLQIVQNIGLKV